MKSRTVAFMALRLPIGTLLLAVGSLQLPGCSTDVEPFLSRWEGTLAPVGPHTLFGQVAAVSQFGRTTVSVAVEEGLSGTSYGWRVSSGGCEQPGSLQGGAAQYPSLVPGEDGMDSKDTVLATLFRHENRYSTWVFLPAPGGGEEVVACGELHSVN